ncbi:MAG: dihydroorotate dehydrogenase [Crenarchaeota archaeon]|nr:dihydroorotate dehydrogenase [Thermoproteota archaeon]
MISARVAEVRRVSSTLWRIDLELLEGVDEPKPFTFAMLWIPRVDEIPLSIAKFSRGLVSFIFRVRGEGTKRLASLRRGDFVALKMPLGKGYAPKPRERILAVAGGVGIAPIPRLLDFCKDTGCDVTIVWGVRTRSEYCDPSLLGLDSDRVEVASDDGSIGFRGTAIDLALEVLRNQRFDTAIAIGPKPMLRAFCEKVRAFAISRALVSVETTVKCGLGICGSCYIKQLPKLLCVDGPVFDCHEVEHFLEIPGA